VTSAADTWEPGRYELFKDERTRPFHDLLGLIEPIEGGRAADLGCGTGELTALLHRAVRAGETIGIDSSAAMLERSATFAGDGVSFRRGDIARFDAERDGEFDLILANASVQWIPDHPRLLATLMRALRPGGQLAVQVPYNSDHASHRLIREIAMQEPFRAALADPLVRDPAQSVLRPEQYATTLHDLGFVEQTVRMEVYGHELGSAAEVVTWTQATTLTPVRARLDAAAYDEFVARYRAAIIDELGDERPYFYTFKRILFRGRLPDGPRPV